MKFKSIAAYQYLRDKIISGEMKAGEQLCPEEEMAVMLEISRITLRSSLALLEKDGLIERLHGRGTFVRSYLDNATPAVKPTVMFIHSNDPDISLTWHYLAPSAEQRAKELYYNFFSIACETLNHFSCEEIAAFVKRENIVGICAVLSHFNGREKIISLLRAADRPTILFSNIENDTKATGFPTIGNDQKNSYQAAIKHLAADCGYRRIALIGKEPDAFRLNSAAECIKLLKKFDAIPIPEMIRIIPYQRDKIIQTVTGWLTSPTPPEAILCFSDFYAIAVYEAIRAIGRKIPDDVAVMGICGYPDAKLLAPSLSTIDYNYAETARTAVDMVTIGAAQLSHRIYELKTSLLIRESTRLKSIM